MLTVAWRVSRRSTEIKKLTSSSEGKTNERAQCDVRNIRWTSHARRPYKCVRLEECEDERLDRGFCEYSRTCSVGIRPRITRHELLHPPQIKR
jgi:hypothetical protein